MKEKNRKKKIHILPISNYPSRKEWEKAIWEKITQSPEILSITVTPGERYDLVMRAAVIEGIRSGKSYREIGDELWCSPQTISSIKKGLKEKTYRSYWERGKTERKKKVYSSFSHNTLNREPRRSARTVRTYPPQLSGISRTYYPKQK